jgi:hypothetical protein
MRDRGRGARPPVSILVHAATGVKWDVEAETAANQCPSGRLTECSRERVLAIGNKCDGGEWLGVICVMRGWSLLDHTFFGSNCVDLLPFRVYASSRSPRHG